MTIEKNVYIQLTHLLDVPQNDSKDAQRIAVIVFGIEINISYFTTRLPKKKLDKTIKAIAKVLSQKSVSFINILSLMRFLSFGLQTVRLSRVFMWRL